VSLYRDDDRAVLEIDDDGKGFDPMSSKRGDGLANLEARVEALGGSLSIESAPAQGTTIKMVLPL